MTMPYSEKQIAEWADTFSRGWTDSSPGDRILAESLKNSVSDLIAAVRKETREECARAADAHKGSAAASISVTRWKQMDDETQQEIRAEQRGEDIASERIAAAIRNLQEREEGKT